jgi:hypothetical protein
MRRGLNLRRAIGSSSIGRIIASIPFFPTELFEHVRSASNHLEALLLLMVKVPAPDSIERPSYTRRPPWKAFASP